MKRPANDNMTHIPGTNIYANAAGLEWLERMKAEQAADLHWLTRCLWADFQCPFARRGEGFICQQPKTHKHELADVCTWNWKMERRPVHVDKYQRRGHKIQAQLSLFDYETVWINTTSGRVSKTYPAPVTVVPSCKQMAVAHMHWMIIKQGWANQTWRILPRTSTKADLAWKDKMIERHGLRACVFDEF